MLNWELWWYSSNYFNFYIQGETFKFKALAAFSYYLNLYHKSFCFTVILASFVTPNLCSSPVAPLNCAFWLNRCERRLIFSTRRSASKHIPQPKLLSILPQKNTAVWYHVRPKAWKREAQWLGCDSCAPDFDFAPLLISPYCNAAEKHCQTQNACSEHAGLSSPQTQLCSCLNSISFCGGVFRRRVYILQSLHAGWVSWAHASSHCAHPLFQTFGLIPHLAICN